MARVAHIICSLTPLHSTPVHSAPLPSFLPPRLPVALAAPLPSLSDVPSPSTPTIPPRSPLIPPRARPLGHRDRAQPSKQACSIAPPGDRMDSSGPGPSSAAGAVAPDVAPKPPAQLSRYESQKRRDWNTFLQYLRNHRPPLTLARCSGAHVIEFLRYLDQFGKTKVHAAGCAYYGQPSPPGPCPCPLRQAWGSLDALIGRLRAAYEESGGTPESNPFAARAVRIYLREVRDSHAKARGIPYEKKKRKRAAVEPSSSSAGAGTAAVGGDEGTAAASAAEAGGSGSTAPSIS